MAKHNRGSFYDEDGVHQRYTEHRNGEPHLSANFVMEEPAVLAEAGDPAGLRILDLGCGDGSFGRRMLTSAARSYRGIDNSHRMIQLADQNLAGTAGRADLADIKNVALPPGSVDLVIARLFLHYVEDFEHVVELVAQGLAANGRFIFTVVHPVITSYDNHPTGPRTNWTVDDYFETGSRSRDWLGSMVTWHHRAVEDYVSAVTKAGLTLTALRECEPDPTRLDRHPEELARRRRVPLFHLLSARV